MGRSRRSEAGISLVEVMIAVAVLIVTSLALAYAFTSTGLASQLSDRSVGVRNSLESVAAYVAERPYEQLLALNGVTYDSSFNAATVASGVDVTIAANLVRTGLVLVECSASDHRTRMVIARLATYRAEGT